MTPKEKAYELVMYKFIEWTPAEEQYEVANAKKCGIIAVDEIMYILDKEGYYEDDNKMRYWEEVKKEIEKL